MKLVIFGTSNDLKEIAIELGWNFVGFASDTPREDVVCSIADAHKIKDAYFINGIGSAKSFRSKPDIISRSGVPRDRFINLISLRATVASSAKIGVGVTMAPNVVIGANASVGDHVIILPNSVVSHDSTVDDYTCICCGVCISGRVTIGNNAYIGTNAAIKEDVTIHPRTLVGMGSVVTKSITTESVVVGNPARAI